MRSCSDAKAEKQQRNGNGNGANLGLEATLFLAADKLRGNMEPSDYKHIALGLIFLKYISDAFEAKRSALMAEDLADPEDPEEYLADNVFWVPREARWSHLQANAKTLWDEYCHEAQYGPHDMPGPLGISPAEAWTRTMSPFIDDVVDDVPQHSAVLLSIAAFWELDQEVNDQLIGAIDPDGIRRLVQDRIDEHAGMRGLHRFNPYVGDAMSGLSESDVEKATLSYLRDLGYETRFGTEICPEGPMPERASYRDVILFNRFRSAIARLNPHLPSDTLDEVVKKVVQAETPSFVEENRRLHRMLVEGLDVEVSREDGTIGGDKAWLIDCDNRGNNHWLAVNQFTVIEDQNNPAPTLWCL